MIKLNRTTGIPARYANRHGLITGQTGTGKTVSLMTLAEQFSQAGVPCLIADVKGDIAALARSCPVDLLDLFGESGRPIRTTIQQMGPDLLARSLELSDVQSATLEIAFAYGETKGVRFDTLAEFRALLSDVHKNKEYLSRIYGQVSAASIAVILRALLRLEKQGAHKFFQSPSYDVADLLQPGKVSILAADKLMQSPRLYSAFLLWILTDLYNRLPEVGDLDKPRLVFFFDEAHLLFTDCPAALLRRIEQTVRLIRSKGVGVYFVSQSPGDIPAIIHEQLAHRLTHDRALQVGSAWFKGIDKNGRPTPIQQIKVDLPLCQLGPLSQQERQPFIPASVPANNGMTNERFELYLGATFGALFLAIAIWVLVQGIPWGIAVAAFGALLLSPMLKRRH